MLHRHPGVHVCKRRMSITEHELRLHKHGTPIVERGAERRIVFPIDSNYPKQLAGRPDYPFGDCGLFGGTSARFWTVLHDPNAGLERLAWNEGRTDLDYREISTCVFVNSNTRFVIPAIKRVL